MTGYDGAEAKKEFYSTIRDAPVSSQIGAVAMENLQREGITDLVVKDLPTQPISIRQVKKSYIP